MCTYTYILLYACTHVVDACTYVYIYNHICTYVCVRMPRCLHMYTCICMCMCIYIYMCVCTQTKYFCMYTAYRGVSVFNCLYVYIYMYICIKTYFYVHYTYTCMYVDMYTNHTLCMCIDIYTYIHMYIYIRVLYVCLLFICLILYTYVKAFKCMFLSHAAASWPSGCVAVCQHQCTYDVQHYIHRHVSCVM